MSLNDATLSIFLETTEKLLAPAKNRMRIIQMHNILKQKHRTFQWRVIYLKGESGSEVRVIQMLENWETEKIMSAWNSRYTLKSPWGT